MTRPFHVPMSPDELPQQRIVEVIDLPYDALDIPDDVRAQWGWSTRSPHSSSCPRHGTHAGLRPGAIATATGQPEQQPLR